MESTHKSMHDDFDIEESHTMLPNTEQKLKKEHSYRYWVQDNKNQFPQAQNNQLIAPKKIDDPELLKMLTEETKQSINAGSAWNKAGTWYDIFKTLLKITRV